MTHYYTGYLIRPSALGHGITDHGLNGSLEYRLDFPASSAFGTVLMYVYIISLIARKF